MRGIKKAAIGLVLLLGGCIMGCGNRGEEMEFVQQMGTGWNLGNSLESVCQDQTCEGLELECYWQDRKSTRLNSSHRT